MSDLMARPDRLYDLYLFDLDGTIYLGDEALPGALELLTSLRLAQRRIVFLSNNPTKDRDQYVAKLGRLGIQVEPAEVVTTIRSTVAWLLANHAGKTVYPIAEEPLVRALRAAGIAISDDPREIDIVIASFDRTFSYSKLQIAFDAIRRHRRAILITTNPDRYCPMPGGAGEPDAAAIVAAIEACTDTRCVANAGKPDAIMIDTVLGEVDVQPENCIMVGDRLATDIRMAKNAGIASALVLTGDSTVEDLLSVEPEWRPDWVLNGVGDLFPLSEQVGANPGDTPSAVRIVSPQ